MERSGYGMQTLHGWVRAGRSGDPPWKGQGMGWEHSMDSEGREKRGPSMEDTG